jgi:hypothetical protein
MQPHADHIKRPMGKGTSEMMRLFIYFVIIIIIFALKSKIILLLDSQRFCENWTELLIQLFSRFDSKLVEIVAKLINCGTNNYIEPSYY